MTKRTSHHSSAIQMNNQKNKQQKNKQGWVGVGCEHSFSQGKQDIQHKSIWLQATQHSDRDYDKTEKGYLRTSKNLFPWFLHYVLP